CIYSVYVFFFFVFFFFFQAEDGIRDRTVTGVQTCALPIFTRDIVLSLAQEAQIPVEEGHFGIEAIHKADECFLTNTSMGVMPVTVVDGHPVGNGSPGLLTQQLHRLFMANRTRFLEP